MFNEKQELLCRFIREHQKDMYRFAYSYIKNREDAMDIVQESVTKALEAADSLKNPASIKSWLFRIIINEANGMFRKNKKYALTGEWEADMAEAEYSDDITVYVDRQNVLKNVFDLEDKYRMVIVLRYYEEFKINEIARILGINENTVKTRLYKALNILKKALKEG